MESILWELVDYMYQRNLSTVINLVRRLAPAPPRVKSVLMPLLPLSSDHKSTGRGGVRVWQQIDEGAEKSWGRGGVAAGIRVI